MRTLFYYSEGKQGAVAINRDCEHFAIRNAAVDFARGLASWHLLMDFRKYAKISYLRKTSRKHYLERLAIS